jgi:hypothetical protein
MPIVAAFTGAVMTLLPPAMARLDDLIGATGH